MLALASLFAKNAYKAPSDEVNRDKIFITDPITDAQVYVSTNVPGYDLAVGFRGTSSPKDILTDIDMRRVKVEGIPGLLHRGFYRQYKAVRAPLRAIVEKENPKTVLVAAHSLGAALGTIGALDLALQCPSVKIDLVTFGSPRVGDGEFAKAVDSTSNINHIRCVHGRDPVTMAPVPVRFRHTGGLKWFRRDNVRCVRNYIDDHNMDFYVDKCK